MSFVDPIGDMITRIRNAQLRALNNVAIPSSKFRARILDVLKQEGYISNYKILSFRVNSFDPFGPVIINLPLSSLIFVSLGIIIGFFPSLDIKNLKYPANYLATNIFCSRIIVGHDPHRC